MKKCERLELDFEPCRLNHPRDSENFRLGHKFSSSSETRFLTSLCLKHVDVSGRVLEFFLSNCPLLETLHVSHSEELTHISVCGSSLRLKYLHISFCKCIKSIEVYAPNLVSFEYRGEENMEVHIDLKYVPHLCDVSYAGQWDSPWVNDMSKSIPSCLATSQLVNLSISIPYTPMSVVNSPIQPRFSNLRCLTLEFLKFLLPIQRTETFVNACELLEHMPLLHKFKVELEAVEAHILTEVEEFQRIIAAGYLLSLEFKRFGHKEPMMLREVEIVGFVGAAADTVLVYFLSLFAPNLESFVINRCLPRKSRKLFPLALQNGTSCMNTYFYVIYCEFWLLDAEHDFFIDRESLIRYGNHALTYMVVDIIFSQVGLPWFKCIDFDGNGVLTPNEMQFFYEVQLHRMECLALEPVLFEDILCQIIDMIAPEVEDTFFLITLISFYLLVARKDESTCSDILQREDCITLWDLKGSKLSGNVFNILFNLHKFISIPYLAVEEDVDDASNGSSDVWDASLEDQQIHRPKQVLISMIYAFAVSANLFCAMKILMLCSQLLQIYPVDERKIMELEEARTFPRLRKIIKIHVSR
ncbi:hypothetical protein V6N13_128158 [Hibiscus sabdariffa]